MSVKIYVEGGGDRRDLHARCRRGFSEFFAHAGFEGRMPSIVACGGRERAFDRFQTALRRADDNECPMLLIDSEGSFEANAGPWEHLQTRDGWQRPEGAGDEGVHLMVQCMEAWFLADRETLVEYFGKYFRVRALPGNTNIEAIAKDQVLDGLRNATREAKKDGYDKGRDSFKILGRIRPELVKKASAHAKRLLVFLEQKTSSAGAKRS